MFGFKIIVFIEGGKLSKGKVLIRNASLLKFSWKRDIKIYVCHNNSEK